MNLNEIKDTAFRIAKAHGWHEKEYSDEHWLMLVITEISEAVEADRNSRHADRKSYSDAVDYAVHEDKLSGDALDMLERCAFEKYIKDSVEDEMADIVIRCLDFAGLRGVDLSNVRPAAGNDIQDSFTEWAYKLTYTLVSSSEDWSGTLCTVLYRVFARAGAMNTDLRWYINRKMRYNTEREYKHGKLY